MGLQSRSVYAAILACIIVAVTAPNPVIDHQNAPELGALKDDPNRPQQQLRKLLERYNSKVPTEQSSYGGEQTDTTRRRLAQFIDNASPETEENSLATSPNAGGGQSGAPGPAPGPQAEITPVPEPINPFVPPSDDSNLVCCCRTATIYYEEPYQEPPPPYCCCGSRSNCCRQGSLISIICGGGQVCGILMLLSALIAVLVLSICMTGTFYARRRRNQLLAAHAASGAAPNGAIGGVGGTGGGFHPADQITINETEIPGLRVKYSSGCTHNAPITEGEGEEAATTIEHGDISTTIAPSDTAAAAAAENKECPICLDTVALTSAMWAVFPCTHGCCRSCFSDLLRHSSRRVNNNNAVWAVMCPLCRKMAVAPEGEMPSLPSGQQRMPTISEGNHEPSSPSAAAAVVVEVAENSGQQTQQQPSMTAAPPQP
ncbi:hypothetical protein Ndes2526A_g05454 [Nannochloris sp. 'desiccata']